MVRRGLGDVVAVRGRTPAGHLADDVCAALFGPRQRLQDQTPCALAADEAIAARVERSARLLRLVIAPTEREHCREAGNTDRSDGRFGTAAHHHIDVTALEPLQCLTDGVRARGT